MDSLAVGPQGNQVLPACVLPVPVCAFLLDLTTCGEEEEFLLDFWSSSSGERHEDEFQSWVPLKGVLLGALGIMRDLQGQELREMTVTSGTGSTAKTTARTPYTVFFQEFDSSYATALVFGPAEPQSFLRFFVRRWLSFFSRSCASSCGNIKSTLPSLLAPFQMGPLVVALRPSGNSPNSHSASAPEKFDSPAASDVSSVSPANVDVAMSDNHTPITTPQTLDHVLSGAGLADLSATLARLGKLQQQLSYDSVGSVDSSGKIGETRTPLAHLGVADLNALLSTRSLPTPYARKMSGFRTHAQTADALRAPRNVGARDVSGAGVFCGGNMKHGGGIGNGSGNDSDSNNYCLFCTSLDGREQWALPPAWATAWSYPAAESDSAPPRLFVLSSLCSGLDLLFYELYAAESCEVEGRSLVTLKTFSERRRFARVAQDKCVGYYDLELSPFSGPDRTGFLPSTAASTTPSNFRLCEDPTLFGLLFSQLSCENAVDEGRFLRWERESAVVAAHPLLKSALAVAKLAAEAAAEQESREQAAEQAAEQTAAEQTADQATGLERPLEKSRRSILKDPTTRGGGGAGGRASSGAFLEPSGARRAEWREEGFSFGEEKEESFEERVSVKKKKSAPPNECFFGRCFPARTLRIRSAIQNKAATKTVCSSGDCAFWSSEAAD